MNRMLLDAGALIALDRSDRLMWTRLGLARRDRIPLITHAGVVGQVWRGTRQAQLARALRAVQVRALDDALGRASGALLAACKTSDVIDAALVLLSDSGDRIYTSDPDDLLFLAETAGRDLEIVPV